MGDVLPPGTRLGRYEIVQRLALGGMAEIYLARMSGLAGFAKHVVLKRILPSHARDAEFVRMFFNEARYAATLDHPNIAHVYDLGEEQGLHYFTMEYLHGEDCRTLLRELATKHLPLPLEHALTIAVGAAAGCHFAHELIGDDGEPLGLIHRDVSPSNVVVTYAGAVKLVDFGIAKATRLEDVTAIGVTKGKLAYMAPEQCRGEPLDRRVDVYALGVLIYELTTQRRAFSGQNDANVMWAVISGEVPPPSTHVKDFPPALAAIIAKAMHVDREQRYATARELSQAIEAFARDAGLTLNPAALGELLVRTMGPKLEPWKVAGGADGKPGRARTVPPVPSLGGTLPPSPGAEGPTYAHTPVSGSLPVPPEADTVADVVVTTAKAPTGSNTAIGAPRSPWPIVGAATLIAVGLVGGTLYWRENRRATPAAGPVVLVAERGDVSIERDGGAAADAAPPVGDGAPEGGIDAGTAVAGGASGTDGGNGKGGGASGKGGGASGKGGGKGGGTGTRPPKPAGDPLSAAFARHNAAVTACFTEHAGGTLPEVSLRFTVGTDGVPTAVQVGPAAVAGTPLGVCLAAVGRRTRFPDQEAPIVFSIPVKASTR